MDRERKRKDKKNRWKACPTPQAQGGGDSAYERVGDARRKF